MKLYVTVTNVAKFSYYVCIATYRFVSRAVGRKAAVRTFDGSKLQ